MGFANGFCGDGLLAGKDEHAPARKIDPDLSIRGLQIHSVVAHSVDAAVDRSLRVEDLEPGAAVSQETDTILIRSPLMVAWVYDN